MAHCINIQACILSSMASQPSTSFKSPERVAASAAATAAVEGTKADHATPKGQSPSGMLVETPEEEGGPSAGIVGGRGKGRGRGRGRGRGKQQCSGSLSFKFPSFLSVSLDVSIVWS